MTAATGAGQRWTLMQALVWIATRDIKLVEVAGEGDPEMGHFTPGWLTVATACRGHMMTADQAWSELAVAIVNGTVTADGCPALPTFAPTDRKPLTIEACELEVNGEQESINRRCYLSGNSDAQQNWYDTEFRKTQMLTQFPADRRTVNQGGAPERYDWASIKDEFDRIVTKHGLPARTNKRLPTQAALERVLLEYCEHNFDSVPGEERMRARVREWIAQRKTCVHE